MATNDDQVKVKKGKQELTVSRRNFDGLYKRLGYTEVNAKPAPKKEPAKKGGDQ